MEDNPSLSPRIIRRYRSSYSGAFYRRFILGEWTAAKGLVYDFFDPGRDAAERPEGEMEEYAVSVDYGTANRWRNIITHPGVPAYSSQTRSMWRPWTD